MRCEVERVEVTLMVDERVVKRGKADIPNISREERCEPKESLKLLKT